MLPPSISSSQRLMLNALLSALVLRMMHLSDLSLWVDEGATWWNATRDTWTETALAEHNHPPVWWIVSRASMALLRPDEAGLRMPSVVAGMIAIVLTGFLARKLCDPSRTPSRGGFVGLDARVVPWVVMLSSIGGFWIAMSQEARMYSGLLAESIGLSLLYLRWLDKDRRSTLVWYGLLASLALYTHYFAVFPILGHAFHAFVLSRRTRGSDRPVRLMPFFVTCVLAGASFIPWFLYFLKEPPGQSSAIVPPYGRYIHAIWRMAIGPAFVPLDRPRADGGVQSVMIEQPVAITLSALLFLVPLAFGAKALSRDKGLRSFLVATIGIPSLGIVLIGVRYPLVEEKYLVFLAPLVLLLAVVGAVTAKKAWRPVLLGALVVVHAVGLVAYHAREAPAVIEVLGGGHEYGKEQWREVEARVKNTTTKDDVILVHAPFCRLVWDFYASAHTLDRALLPDLSHPCDVLLTPAQILAENPKLAIAKGVVLVLSHECTDDRDYYVHAVATALREAWGQEPNGNGGPTPFPVQWGIRVVVFSRR